MTSLTVTTPFVLSDESLDVLFREARTANTFSDEPVGVEQIEAIYELVKYGPTAMSNQPLRLLVVETDEGRAVSTVMASTGISLRAPAGNRSSS